MADASLQSDIITYKKQGVLPFRNNPGRLKEIQAEIARQSAPEQAHGITIKSVSLDRTTADIARGKTSRNTNLNPEQKNILATYDLNREARSGSLSAAQYDQRLSEINQNLSNETRERTLQFARDAAPGLRAAAAKEEQRFANLGQIDYVKQEQAQTKQLQKVSDDIARTGIDPARLQQSRGTPNPRRDLKITTAAEIEQNRFAKEQAFRTVGSVSPKPKKHSVSLSEGLYTSDKQTAELTKLSTQQGKPPPQKFILFKNDVRSIREQMAAQSGYDTNQKKNSKLQGPNLKENVFFVGANAQGFTMESQRKIEPRVTFSDLFGSNAFTRNLDKIYEFNKPVEERSDKSKVGPGGFSNREIGELTTPFLNRLVEAKDTFVATGEALQGKKAFEWKKGFLGIPNYASIKESPKAETTLDKLAQSKPVNFDDKNARFSIYGSAFAFAAELKAFNIGVNAGTKTGEKIESVIMASKASKAAKLTSEGKEYGITKFDNETFLIAKGTEGRIANIPMDISPSVLFGKVKGKVGNFLSKTPKQVNTLSSGEKIQASIAKIDDDILKLKPFTDKSRFDIKLVENTNKKITNLEKKRTQFETNLTKAALPGPARNPISIVEFGRPSAQFPKGNIFTEFGKPIPLKDTPTGTKIIVQGEVPASTLTEFGLNKLPIFVSKEFGIATKSKPLYGGIVTQESAAKLIAAERLGFIKTISTGKSAPLEAILKKQGDVLRGYSGVKTATTKTKYPFNEPVFSWKSFSRQLPIKSEIKPVLTQGIDAPNKGFRASESFGIVDYKTLPRGVTGYGSKGLRLLKFPKPESIENISTGIGNQNKPFKPFNFKYLKEEKGTGGSVGKAASLTLKDASNAAKNYLSSRPTTAKTDTDILFSAPRFLTPQYHGEISENILVFPQGTSQKISRSGDWFKTPKPESFTMQDEISTMLNPKQPKTKPSQKTNIMPGFSFDTRIITDVIPKQITKQTPKQTPKLIPDEGFTFIDLTKITTIPKQTITTVPGLTFFTPTPTITEQTFFTPQKTPPGTIPKGFPFAAYFPGLYLGAGGYENPASLKKGFAAYGISSDINIKTLPTYSRYSAGTNIFKAQQSEDKMIQNLFYGKPKRKKSGSKKKKGSKK